MQTYLHAFIFALIVAVIVLAGNLLPTPKWLWQWRTKQEGEWVYLQARGIFNPIWHKVLNGQKRPARFATEAVAWIWLSAIR
jgi:hypothetical protein